MCKKRNLKNKILYSCAIVIFMSVILFPIVGSRNVNAQWLYYPANAISLYGTPSITLPFSAYPVPGVGTLSYNLYYPANAISLYGTPSIPVLPPTTATVPIATSAVASSTSIPTSSYNSINILSPLSLSAYSSLSPFTTLAQAVPPANTYLLYYPVGTAPGISILPPAATGVGTLPYNLYYPPGTIPGIPVLPPTL